MHSNPDGAVVVMRGSRMPCIQSGQLHELFICIGRKRGAPRLREPEDANLADHGANAAVTAHLWHPSLGYRNMADVRKLGELDVGVPKGLAMDGKCDTCEMGKHAHTSLPSKVARAPTRPFEVIHVDLGSVETPSLRGNRHFALVTCQQTRYRFVLFMQRKSDFLPAFKALVLDVQALTDGGKICRIQSDNGGEFIGAECKHGSRARACSTPPLAPMQLSRMTSWSAASGSLWT